MQASKSNATRPSAHTGASGLYGHGVRRRSSVPLSAVLEIADDDDDNNGAEEEDAFINAKDTDSLLSRRSSSSVASSLRSDALGRRRSSAQNRSAANGGVLDTTKDIEPLIGSFYLYSTVLLTILLGPQLGWEIAQLNLGVFHNPKDCAQRPVKTGRCIVYPGHSDIEWVMAVMCWVLGAAIGSLLCNIPADKYGRRFVVVGNATLMIMGGALQTFSPNIYFFALGRLCNGIASGSGSTITSVYLGEIGPPQQKASFVVAFQATGSVGLVAITLVHFAITGSPTSWRWIMAFPSILGLIQLVLAPRFLVESPKWLLVHKRAKEAASAFQKLYKSGSFHDLERSVKSDVEKNVRRQILEAQQSPTSQVGSSFWKDAFSTRCSKQFTISCILCVARQFGGVSAVFYYSSGIFAGAGIQDSRIGNLLLGVVNLSAVFIVCIFMKKLPRRTALLIGMGGMVLCSIGMTWALVNKSGLAVFFTACYVGFNSISLSPLPFLVTAEVLPEHIKTKGISFTTFINWSCNLIVGACFPILAHYTGNYTFVPFTVLLSCFWICVFTMLPETKDKTVEQIQLEFHNQVSLFDKFKKAKILDSELPTKHASSKDMDASESVATSVSVSGAAGSTAIPPSAIAAAAANSRRTSVEFVMPSQPPRPNFSRTA